MTMSGTIKQNVLLAVSSRVFYAIIRNPSDKTFLFNDSFSLSDNSLGISTKQLPNKTCM